MPFDLTRPQTYAAALDGVSRLFLLFPPQLNERSKRISQLLGAAKQAGVERIVFLSVRNANRLPILPHRHIEKAIEASGIAWTHLRPNDFMQNLATVPAYRDAIRDHDEIWSAAGQSLTSYVDVRDVGAVAVKVLTEEGHAGKAYTLTGPASLSLDHVAGIMTRVLGRGVRYMRPSIPAFLSHVRRSGTSWPLAILMTGIGLVARSGLARSVDPTLVQLLGREPYPFKALVYDYAATWSRDSQIRLAALQQNGATKRTSALAQANREFISLQHPGEVESERPDAGA